MKVHNIQKITIFFCALLISTFGHDYLKAHHDNRAHIQHSNRNHHQLISHFKYRSANDSQQQCNWECIPESDDQDQNLHLTVHGGLVAIHNDKEHVALVVDINAHIGAVFNGTSGGCVLINLKTNKGYDIPSGVWTVGKESFQQWFDKLTTLETIWNQGQKNGTAFDINQITETALHHIAQVFQFLGVEIAASVRASLKSAIKIFIKHTQNLIDIFKGVINMVSDGLGKLSVKLHGDLEWVINTLNGIKDFVSKIPGGLKALHDQGVNLPFQAIFNASSGIEAFANLLEEIGQQVDLSKILKDMLNRPLDILKFIVDLGGDISTGINGFFRVLYQIVKAHSDNDSIPHLIETIIRYSTSKSCDFAKIRSHVQKLLKLIQDQIKKYNTDDEWSTLQNFLQKLLDPKSVAIGGISISELLHALNNVGQESPIKTIITIVWSIRVSIKIQQTIPQLVLGILQKLNSQIGLQILTKLIPDLQLKYSSTGEIDVVGTIKDQLNQHDLLPLLKDLPKLLKKLPIIGKVIKAIEDGLQQISHNEYNFDDLIKCNGAEKIAAQIRKWLKSVLHINVSGSIDTGSHGGIDGVINGIIGHGSGENSDKGDGGNKQDNSKEHSGENSNHSGEQSGDNHGNNDGGKGGFGGGIFNGISHVIHGSQHNQQQGSVKIDSKKHQQIKEKNHYRHH